MGCVDESIIEENNKGVLPDDNIKEFSDGYSLSFYVSLDQLSGENTRADATYDDYWLYDIENYLKPDEFRVLFFDKQGRFLFESKTRWLTSIEAKDGNSRWRVGIPVFQYLSDNFQQEGENAGESMESSYKWDEIVDYMKKNPFKIAILANRPDEVSIPYINDFDDNLKNNGNIIRDTWDGTLGKLGPFWTPKNSVITTYKDINNWNKNNDLTSEEDRAEDKDNAVMTVMDLHHCQYDPIYDAKNNNIVNGEYRPGAYSHVIKNVKDPEVSSEQEVPYMGAVMSWLGDDKRKITNEGEINNSAAERSFYRLPEDKFADNQVNNQYIPMFGIQDFDSIPDWTKGTTYNVSTQTASQATDYSYRTIMLLRAVVKLELKIPMYDDQGNFVKVDLNHTQLWFNNYMTRTEPLDVVTPTDQIWSTKHSNILGDCEWTLIRDYGPLVNTTKLHDNMRDYRDRTSWYYGRWKQIDPDFNFNGESGWNYEENAEYVKVFNPIVQRLQIAYICNNFLPIGIPREKFLNSDGKNAQGDKYIAFDKLEEVLPGTKTEAEEKYYSPQGYYYRWVIYCGERYINDANRLGYLSSTSGDSDAKKNSPGYIAFFRIKINNTVYRLPLVDYSQMNTTLTPSSTSLKAFMSNSTDGNIKTTNPPAGVNEYCHAIAGLFNTKSLYNCLPYPLLRNHHYRMTVNIGDKGYLNVELMNAQDRNIDYIFK